MVEKAADRSGSITSHRERIPVPKEGKKFSEKIRDESEKSSVEYIVESSVARNNSEQREDPIGEGGQTTAEKYMERWKII